MSNKGRRSSILKPARNPLYDLTCVDGDNDFTENIKTRRVSFASANVIQKFATDEEKNTIWFDKYEESLNHTTSSQNSTLKQQNDTSSDDGLNCTRLDLEISPDRNAVEDNVSLGSGCMDLTIPATVENPEFIQINPNPFDIKNEKRQTICFNPNTIEANMDESIRQQNESMDLMEITENKIELSPEVDKENIAPIIIEKQPKRQTIHFRNQTESEMDITNRFAMNEDVIDKENIPVSKPVKNSRQTIHFQNQEMEMEKSERYQNDDLEIEEEIVQIKIPIRSRQTIHYQNNEMDITEKYSENIRYNPAQIQENQMELTEKLPVKNYPPRQTIHYRNQENDMEFTEKLPPQIINPSRQTTHYRNQENDMEFTEKLPPQIINPSRQTIHYRNQENEMEFTEKLPPQIIKPSRQTIHYRNQENDMDFTDKLPPQIINPSRQTIHYRSQENDMEFTEKLPPQIINPSRQTIHYRNQENEMEFTEKLPAQIINPSRKTIHYRSEENEMEFTEKLPPQTNPSRQTIHYRNQENDMEFTERISHVRQNTRQTIHYNCEGEMDLTEKLPPTRPENKYEEMEFTQKIPLAQNIPRMKSRQTVHYNNCEGEMDLTEKLPTTFNPFKQTQYNQDMEFTERLPTKSRRTVHYNDEMEVTEKLPPQIINPFRQTIHRNEENDMEFTEKLPPQKVNPSRQTIHHRNQENDMEFTEKLPVQTINPFRKTIHYRSEENEMEFTEKLPPQKINPLRQTIHYRNQENDMEFTEKLPVQIINPSRKTIHYRSEENEMEFTEKLPPQKVNPSRQTINFRNQENEMELTEKLPPQFNPFMQKNYNQDFEIEITENLSLKPNNPSRQTIHYQNQNEMEFTEKLPIKLNIPSRQTIHFQNQDEMEFTEKLPSNLNNPRQSVYYQKQDDMEFTEKLPLQKTESTQIDHNNQEIEMDFTERMPLKPNKSRQTIHFNNQDINIDITENLPIKSKNLPENIDNYNKGEFQSFMVDQSIQTFNNKETEKVTSILINQYSQTENIEETLNKQTDNQLIQNEKPQVISEIQETKQIIYSIEDSTEDKENQIVPEISKKSTQIIYSIKDDTEFTEDNNSRTTKNDRFFNLETTYDNQFRALAMKYQLQSTKLPEEIISFNKTGSVKRRSVDYNNSDNSKMDISEQYSIGDESICKMQRMNNESTDNLCNAIELMKFKMADGSYDNNMQLTQNSICITENLTKCDNTLGLINYKIDFKPGSEYSKIINEDIDTEILRLDETKSNGENSQINISGEEENEEIKNQNEEVEIERDSSIELDGREKEEIILNPEIVRDESMEIDHEEISNMKIINNESKNIKTVIEKSMSVENEDENFQTNEEENESINKSKNVSLDSNNGQENSLCLLSDSLLNETHEFISNENNKQTVTKPIVTEQLKTEKNKSCIVIESSLDSSCAETSMNEKNLSKAESKSEYSSDFNSSDCMIIENNSNTRRSFNVDYSYLINDFLNNLEVLRKELRNEVDIKELNELEISLEIEKQYNEIYGKCKSPEEITEEKKVRSERNCVFDDVVVENKPKSYMDKIKEMSMRFPSWQIVKLDVDLVDFTTLDEKFLFEVEFDSETGIVKNISFYSLPLNDDIKPYEKYIFEVFHKKITISYIASSCGKNYTILSLLDFITLQVQEMEKIIKELEDLSVQYGIIIDKDLNVNITFRSFRLRWLFDIEFNLLDVEDISPEKIRFKIGTNFKKKDMRLNDIKSFVTEKPKDYKFLRSYIESVTTFIEMLEKKNKK